jgi:Ca-activated chloride channel family protein
MQGPQKTLALTLSAVLGVLVVSPRAQEVHPTFRAGTQRVALSVVVRDGDGRPVLGLSNKDFRVLDNGYLAHISDFVTDEQSINVAILIDTSGSMVVGDRLDAARAAAREVVRLLRPGQDSAGLFTFDRRLRAVLPFSTDFSSVPEGLSQVVPFGSTSLRDAIAATAERLAAEASPRRAVVVISDGFDNSSRLTSSEVSRIASGIDVPVYVLGVGTAAESAADPGEAATSADPLELLARRTGGVLLPAATPAQIRNSVREVLMDLRSSYLVAFAPRNVPGWHQLSVTVSRDYANVRTRTGFWIGETAVTGR